jgi:DNA-binding NarL/FixJ family response regulator
MEVEMIINLVIFGRTFLFAEALAKLLESFTGMNIVVVGITCDAHEMNEMLAKSSVDILVSDYPGCCNFIRQANVKKLPRVLLLSDRDHILVYDELKELVKNGLAGIMPRGGDSNLLKKAILKLQAGELWIDHKTIGCLLTNLEKESSNITLTKKEKEILKHVCAGETNKSIADKMCVSEQTVKSHCNHLFKKFGVPNRVKLALIGSKMFHASGKDSERKPDPHLSIYH